MAFHNKKTVTNHMTDIANYQQFLKTDKDEVLRQYQTPEGIYLNVTHVHQTEKEKEISEAMGKFYKIANSIDKQND